MDYFDLNQKISSPVWSLSLQGAQKPPQRIKGNDGTEYSLSDSVTSSAKADQLLRQPMSAPSEVRLIPTRPGL